MKIKFLALLLLNSLLFINILYSQNTWSTEGVLGGSSKTRHRAVAFSIGNKGYVGTGTTRGSFGSTGWKEFKDFWEYNPTTHVWTQLADVGGTTRFDAIGFSLGDKGYIGTGQWYSSSMGKNVKLQDMWEYNSITNIWSSVANILGGDRAGAVAFTIGNKAYVGTGSNSSTQYSQDFYEFDPIHNTWAQKKSFEGTGRNLAAGFSTCGKGYIGTGLVGNNTGIGDFWEYDPSNNDWISKSNFSGGSSYESKGFSICTKGYILKGSENGNCDSKKFWEYDPNFDSWLQLADFPTDQRYHPVAFNIGGKGYVGTGKRCNQEVYFGDFFSYTPFELNVPDQPSDINGKLQVCVSEIQIYYTPLDECSKTYNWTVPQNSTIIKYSLKKDSITVKFASNSGNISVTASNDCGTSKSFSIPITVNPNPTPSISGLSSVCSGGSVLLDAGAGYSNYSWSNGGGAGQVTTYSNITSTTTYIVTVTNTNGCTGTALKTITIIQLSKLNFEASQNSGDCPFMVDFFNRSITSNPTSFEWTIYNTIKLNPIISFEEDPKGIEYKEAGNFRTILKITDDCGINTFQVDSFIKVNCPVVGTDEDNIALDFSIYPNPTDGFITILQSNNVNYNNFKLTVINSIGKIIEVKDLSFSDINVGKTIDLRNYSNGIYFIIISNSEMYTRFKICKF